MANIINIFHKDILPTDVPAEYEMLGAGPDSEVLLYRRGLSPRAVGVNPHARLNIPLVPFEGPFASSVYTTSRELKQEVTNFILDCIPYLRNQEMRIADAVKLADQIFASQGTFLSNVLFSSDLENRIGPVYDILPSSKCINLGRQVKNALILLPEEVFTGTLSIKDAAPDGFRSVYGYSNDHARYGMMLSKDNALMCTPIS